MVGEREGFGVGEWWFESHHVPTSNPSLSNEPLLTNAKLLQEPTPFS